MTHFEVCPMPDELDEALKKQLLGAEVATIGHWRRWGFPNRAIQRVTPGAAVVGTAITVACPSEDNSIVHHAVSLLRPGDILVIDRLGDNDIACWGGMVHVAAELRGAAAVIIDGPCTDVREIERSQLPLWCRGVSGRTSLPLGVAGRLNVPVSVGGAVVMPGDAILGDDDGIVILPPDEALAIAHRAVEHQSRAAPTLATLREGRSLGELSGASSKVLRSTEGL